MATRSRLSVPDLRNSLLAVYRSDSPFVVRDGAVDGVDLVAELRFGDEEWNQLFREVNLKMAYTIALRFDEAKFEVPRKNGSARSAGVTGDILSSGSAATVTTPAKPPRPFTGRLMNAGACSSSRR
jgi:hypothetical protein